ncbi:hypothetical protein [Olivibacter sitiensis]|uniref:hypothetical protein n=1 Tax=Olivibacter sitiensis TaxID=376470 RepID=UPI00041A71F2|nr:hypothetical protein [Olivibacter sitiensis]
MARKRLDILWKGILEDLFIEFLRFMVPNADEIFDFERGLDFLDKEMEQLFPPEGDEFSLKVVDKLARVYRRTGEEEWVLIHVEVQHQYRNNLARRMLDYYVRIRDKYGVSITAFAILTEASTRQRPDTYEEGFLGTRLRYTFNTFKVSRQTDEELLANGNPFALVVLIAKTAFAGSNMKESGQRDGALLAAKDRLMRELVSRGMPTEKIRVLMNFLTYYVHFEDEEISAIFEEHKREIIGRSETMGIEEQLLDIARKEERAKAEAEKLAEKNKAAKKMLQSGFDVQLVADILDMTVEQVEKLK